MNIIEFREHNVAHKNNIIFCIVDNIGSYQSEWQKEIIKNISDFCLQNITIQGYTVLVGYNEDELLKKASTYDSKYAVVFSTGTEFITRYVFFDLLEKLCQEEDFFIMGHVLDRGEFYYELHHQCYVINLNLFKELTDQSVGQVEFFSPHTQIEPNRSKETYHDAHTPLWVAQGSNLKEYSHKAHGWKLLSQAFEKNLPVKVFTEDFRESKKHYYPENEESFFNEINYAYSRFNFCSGLAIYPINSETMSWSSVPGPIEQLVVPASGLGWIEHLCHIGYTENTVVKFFDYSPATLEYISEIVNWDGKDYPKFFKNHFAKKYGYLQNGNSIIYCGPQDIEQEWADFVSSLDWSNVWNDIKSKVRFEFHLVNLLDTTADLNWITATNGTTLINISNIYNYIGTSTFYSLKQRLNAENNIITKLKEINPNIYVHVSRRAYDGFDLPTYPQLTSVKNLLPVEISSLKKPTWHYGPDWN